MRDGREGGFQVVDHRCARAKLADPVFLTRGKNGLPHEFGMLCWTLHLEADLARHALAQERRLHAFHQGVPEVHELDVPQVLAGHLLQDSQGIRPRDLELELADGGLGERFVVALGQPVLEPGDDGSARIVLELLLSQAKQHAFTDHLSPQVAEDGVLRLTNGELRNAVDHVLGKEAQGIRPGDLEFIQPAPVPEIACMLP